MFKSHEYEKLRSLEIGRTMENRNPILQLMGPQA